MPLRHVNEIVIIIRTATPSWRDPSSFGRASDTALYSWQLHRRNTPSTITPGATLPVLRDSASLCGRSLRCRGAGLGSGFEPPTLCSRLACVIFELNSNAVAYDWHRLPCIEPER